MKDFGLPARSRARATARYPIGDKSGDQLQGNAVRFAPWIQRFFKCTACFQKMHCDIFVSAKQGFSVQLRAIHARKRSVLFCRNRRAKNVSMEISRQTSQHVLPRLSADAGASVVHRIAPKTDAMQSAEPLPVGGQTAQRPFGTFEIIGKPDAVPEGLFVSLASLLLAMEEEAESIDATDALLTNALPNSRKSARSTQPHASRYRKQ